MSAETTLSTVSTLDHISRRRWFINPACELHWRQWGESSIVFNAASGQTHFINNIAAALLRLLTPERAGFGIVALSQDELYDRLCDALNLESDQAFRDYVDELLSSLDELGLITCQP